MELERATRDLVKSGERKKTGKKTLPRGRQETGGGGDRTRPRGERRENRLMVRSGRGSAFRRGAREGLNLKKKK